MTEANPQPAATTTNAEPAAPAADNGAQTSDLDTLLSSYDEQVARQPAPQPAIQPNGNTEIAAALQEIGGQQWLHSRQAIRAHIARIQ
jgi:hypothetical protein